MTKNFMERLKEDKEFVKKLDETPDYEARMTIVGEEGYSVKSVKDYIERSQNDPDFFERMKSLEKYEDKVEFILSEGYYFTQQDLMNEHEKIAKKSEEELLAVSGGSYENDYNYSCCQTTCPSHFKCTWG